MKIKFMPQNIVCEISENDTILEAAGKAGVVIDGNCSGMGTCGKCKVMISGVETAPMPGDLEKISDKELKQGIRLACLHLAEDGMVVEIPDYESTAARKNRMIKLPDDFNPDVGEKFGVAVDMGTTTIVVMLWDLKKGMMMDIKSFANPQGAYGADVISRISYTVTEEDGLKTLHRLTIKGINDAVRELIQARGVAEQDIVKYSVVGNTTMSHLFLNINPESLAFAPFKPQFEGRINEPAVKLGLIGSEDCRVSVTPNIAGHVGADITAGILTTDIMDKVKSHLFIDVGTNGEIVFSSKGKVVTCSTAAGPAFEGSSIKYGMRAAAGAIENVRIGGEGVTINTIGDIAPIGICGSGIIDAIGQMIQWGIVDKRGRLLSRDKLQEKGLSTNILNSVDEEDGVPCFVLYDGGREQQRITITQRDVREVQLAKAAIAAGIKTLMRVADISEDQLDQVSIAGAFGSYIDIESAVAIGLLPKIDLSKIKSIGNAAGVGAAMVLLSEEYEKRADDIAREVEHIELAQRSDFQELYMSAMAF